MEQLAHPIRQFFTMPGIFKTKDVNGPVVRMSEINRSYSDASHKTPSESFNLGENFKNISQQMAKLAESVSEQAIIKSKEELNQELNDLDFKQFVADLSLNMDQIPVPIPVLQRRKPANRIIYERTEGKETIIIDSIPNRDSDDIQVVKVKITLPKDNGKISVQPITNCTSTFRRSKISAIRAVRPLGRHENAHHLPIMGKAALLSKHRNSENFRNNQDSEIIKELVTQRFQDTLMNYYEKSFQRQTSRNREECEQVQDEDEPQPLSSTFSDDLHGISSIASESMLSISTQSPVDVRSSGSSRTASRSFRASTACSSRLQSTESLNTGTAEQVSEDSYQLDSVGCLVDDMKFLLSTDAMNCETTDEVNENHSTFAQQSPTSKTSTNSGGIFDTNETVEYDATQFLRDALGDELNNYYSTDASYMNSIGTSNISALVSRADTHEYNTTIFENSAQPSDYDFYPFNKRVTELLAESNVQYQAILQTSKALSFCRSTKEFSSGEEELEAERILLIATCKRDAIRDEIHRLEYEDIHLEANMNSSGCIKIQQIVLPPKQRASIYASRIFEKKKTKFSDWYLCVLSHGTSVFATTAVQADNDGFVRFRNEIVFAGLNPDFEIKLALYSMRVRPQKTNMSHETKYHLHNDTTFCPLSPPRIMKHNKQYKNITIPNYVNEKSSYCLCGQFTLKINNIANFGHFKMSHLNLTTLEGNFIMDFVSSVSLKENYSGFLDVGLETQAGELLTWNRRWCTLCEGLLKYYNYPGEENPLGFIDLHYCATAAVTSADRQICARPRTLLVEVFTHNDDAKLPQIGKYFLAADSKQYMDMWCNKLNCTINALHTWNAMKCHTY